MRGIGKPIYSYTNNTVTIYKDTYEYRPDLRKKIHYAYTQGSPVVSVERERNGRIWKIEFDHSKD